MMDGLDEFAEEIERCRVSTRRVKCNFCGHSAEEKEFNRQGPIPACPNAKCTSERGLTASVIAIFASICLSVVVGIYYGSGYGLALFLVAVPLSCVVPCLFKPPKTP